MALTLRQRLTKPVVLTDMMIRSRRRPLTRTPADVGLDYISERADEVVGFFRANL